MRRIVYLYEFVRNLFKYFNKKVNVSKLQVWVGQTCTLKCKNCSQLFPYINQRLYNIDEVISDLKNTLKYINPAEIHIIGGEPFTNPDIGKLIQFICQINPNKLNKIVSNGTIIPKSDVIELLAKNKEHMFITISKYPIVQEKQEKFYKILSERGINVINVLLNEDWYYVGDNNQQEIHNYKILKRNFKMCWDKSCNTLADGILSICPRMHNSPLVFNKEKTFFIEHLPIKIIPDNFIGRAMVATCLTVKTYRESCRHCWGISNASNIKVKKAEQIGRI